MHNFIVSFFVVFTLFLGNIVSVAYAANSYNVATGATATITEHGVCQKVTNSSTSRMVPTKTAAEWSSFRSSPGAGISLAACPLANCIGGAVSWSGSYGGCSGTRATVASGGSASASYSSGNPSCGSYYSGSITYSCTNGVWTTTSSYCNYSYGGSCHD